MTGWLAGLFASGRIIDIILALMALETVSLLAFYRATGRGVASRAGSATPPDSLRSLTG